MSVCVKTAEVSIFLMLLPFKQQPDGLWEVLWPWIVLPVSGGVNGGWCVCTAS